MGNMVERSAEGWTPGSGVELRLAGKLLGRVLWQPGEQTPPYIAERNTSGGEPLVRRFRRQDLAVAWVSGG